MKKALLVSSLLLAGAGCAAEEKGLADTQAAAFSARAGYIDATFLSNEIFTFHAEQVRMKLTFIRAENYELDGNYFDGPAKTGGLEYEVVAQYVSVATGRVYGHDRSFFAKTTGKGHVEIFQCDSSRPCNVNELALQDCGSTQVCGVKETTQDLSFFDCDSSRNCKSTTDNTKMTIVATGNEPLALTITNHDIWLVHSSTPSLEFTQVKN